MPLVYSKNKIFLVLKKKREKSGGKKGEIKREAIRSTLFTVWSQ